MSRDVISRQLLLSGRVTDAITGSRTRSLPSLEVEDAARPERRLGLVKKILPEGLYGVSLDPNFNLPAADVTLRLTVTAPGYQAATHDVALTAAQLARIENTVTVGGDSETVTLVGTGTIKHDFALVPQPVTLAGRIVEASDPAQPIAGASVSVTAPAPAGPAVSDSLGFFSLSPVPVAAELALEISAPEHQTATPAVRLDFRTAINQRNFALEQS